MKDFKSSSLNSLLANSCEIGDGNLNFVYKITHGDTTYALKHAKPYLKILGEDFKLTQKRVIAEMNSMEYFYSIAPSFVPKIEHKNEANYFFVMEYLENYEKLRNVQDNFFAYKLLGDFLYKLATNKPKQNLYYECDALKQITKNYVFEFPFLKNHEALVIADFFPQREFSIQFLANKERLKEIFLHSKKALIHGDLHTDSVMINKDKIAVIDSEFSLFSDISFDIGNLLAHTLFHSIAFENDAYKKKFLLLFERLESLGDFKELVQNSVGFCAVEMARRLYVPAKSKDLENAANKKKAYELSFEIANDLGSHEICDVNSLFTRIQKHL